MKKSKARESRTWVRGIGWKDEISAMRRAAEENREIRAQRRLRAEGFLDAALSASRRNQKSAPARDFYKSREWASVRYAALLRSNGRCQCCGADPSGGARLHVDHIKPRSKFPELALSLGNLQVLCELCNLAKSNLDITDWRRNEEKVPDDHPYSDAAIGAILRQL